MEINYNREKINIHYGDLNMKPLMFIEGPNHVIFHDGRPTGWGEKASFFELAQIE